MPATSFGPTTLDSLLNQLEDLNVCDGDDLR